MIEYAIGMQDFSEVRRGPYVYVDKTSYIPLLMQNGKYKFLARPRRFGKSLLLSTLEYFFLGEKELFKDLAIEKTDWKWEEYPVIHIDFNGADYTREQSLMQKLKFNLSQYEQKFGILADNDLLPSQRFQNLIIELHGKIGKQVVVLVDEYEKPVLDTLDHPDMMEKHKETLRGFFSVLKSSDKYLKFVFITGVTKFGQMNIFSGLNNIRDISLDPKFGGICGVTEKELLSNFSEGIDYLAQQKEITKEEAVNLLKINYDGYHFSRNCPDIYNPFSLINCFADGKIFPYWSATGVPYLLIKVLIEKQFDIPALEGTVAEDVQLIGVDRQFNDPITLFYQTGYLTIKDYNAKNDTYILGYPNKEVKKDFFEYLLPTYSGINTVQTRSFINSFLHGLYSGDPEKSIKALESFTAGINYELVPEIEVERHFQYIIYMLASLLVYQRDIVKAEERTSDGRIDLLISTDKFIYVLEFKKDSKPQKAIRQIEEKDYALQFRSDERKIFLIGINFSTEKRRIDGFEIKEYSK